MSHFAASARLLALASAAWATAATAAPDVPAGPFAAGTGGTAAAPGVGSLTQVSLALVLVLGLVFALAWLMRRVRGMQRPGAPGIQVLAELSLGPKERAVLLQVERTRLLVGVAAGQVRTLQVLSDAEPMDVQTAASPAGAPPGFGELLRRSLGR